MELSAEAAEEARSGRPSQSPTPVHPPQLANTISQLKPCTIRPPRPFSAFPGSPPRNAVASPTNPDPAAARTSFKWDRTSSRLARDPSRRLTIGDRTSLLLGSTTQDDSRLPAFSGGTPAGSTSPLPGQKLRLSARYLEDGPLPVIGGLVPSAPRAPLPPGKRASVAPDTNGSPTPLSPQTTRQQQPVGSPGSRGPPAGRPLPSPPPGKLSSQQDSLPPPPFDGLPPPPFDGLPPPPFAGLPSPPSDQQDEDLIPPPPQRASQQYPPSIWDTTPLSESVPPPSSSPNGRPVSRMAPAHRQRPPTLRRGGSAILSSSHVDPTLSPPCPRAFVSSDSTVGGEKEENGYYSPSSEDNEDEDDDALAALLLQHGAVREDGVHLDAALGGLVSSRMMDEAH